MGGGGEIEEQKERTMLTVKKDGRRWVVEETLAKEGIIAKNDAGSLAMVANVCGGQEVSWRMELEEVE